MRYAVMRLCGYAAVALFSRKHYVSKFNVVRYALCVMRCALCGCAVVRLCVMRSCIKRPLRRLPLSEMTVPNYLKPGLFSACRIRS